MINRSSRGVVCLSLVVGFFMAIPLGQRAQLNPSSSARLSRAEEQMDDFGIDLKAEDGTVCSGVPDYAKGVTTDIPAMLSVPLAKPAAGQDRKDSVLALIKYPWEDLGYSIVFKGARVGYRAMTLTSGRRIEVYVRPGEDLMHQAYDLAHELGHAFDLKYNNEERRRQWADMRGIKKSRSWFGCDACPDYATPAGDFAETFAYLLLGPGNYHSLMAPAPKPEQIAELAEFCKIDHINDILMASMPKKSAPAAVKMAKVEKKTVKQPPAEEPAPATVELSSPAIPEPPDILNLEEILQAEHGPVSAQAPIAIQAPKADTQPDLTAQPEATPQP